MIGHSVTDAPTPAARSRRPDVAALLRWFILLLPLSTMLTTAPHADEPPVPPANQDPVAHRQQLLAERDELIRTANAFYQQKKYDEAMQRLQKLLALYKQIYPPDQYPNGHQDVVECCVDICRVAEQQGSYQQILQVGQLGIDLCRQIPESPEYPNRDFHLASLLSATGTSHFHRGEFSVAATRTQEALSIITYSEMCRGSPNYSVLTSRIMTSLGTALLFQGDYASATEWLEKSVKEQKQTLRNEPLCKLHVALARSQYCYGQSLRKLGLTNSALKQFQESYDTSMRLYIIARDSECDKQLVDTLIEIGAAHLDAGDIRSSRDALMRAQSRIALMDGSPEGNRLLQVRSRLLALSRLEGSIAETRELIVQLTDISSGSEREQHTVLGGLNKADALLQVAAVSAENWRLWCR